MALFIAEKKDVSEFNQDIVYIALRAVLNKDFGLNAKRLLIHDEATFNHCIDTTVNYLILASNLQIGHDDNTNNSLACFGHDIAKVHTSSDILKSNKGLNKKEKDKLKVHPPIGARMCHDTGLPYEVALCVLRHHNYQKKPINPSENFLNKLYKKDNSKLDVGCCVLVALSDQISTMTSGRPYKQKILDKKSVLDSLADNFVCKDTDYFLRKTESSFNNIIDYSRKISKEVSTISRKYMM